MIEYWFIWKNNSNLKKSSVIQEWTLAHSVTSSACNIYRRIEVKCLLLRNVWEPLSCKKAILPKNLSTSSCFFLLPVSKIHFEGHRKYFWEFMNSVTIGKKCLISVYTLYTFGQMVFYERCRFPFVSAFHCKIMASPNLRLNLALKVVEKPKLFETTMNLALKVV